MLQSLHFKGKDSYQQNIPLKRFMCFFLDEVDRVRQHSPDLIAHSSLLFQLLRQLSTREHYES